MSNSFFQGRTKLKIKIYDSSYYHPSYFKDNDKHLTESGRVMYIQIIQQHENQ